MIGKVPQNIKLYHIGLDVSGNFKRNYNRIEPCVLTAAIISVNDEILFAREFREILKKYRIEEKINELHASLIFNPSGLQRKEIGLKPSIQHSLVENILRIFKDTNVQFVFSVLDLFNKNFDIVFEEKRDGYRILFSHLRKQMYTALLERVFKFFEYHRDENEVFAIVSDFDSTISNEEIKDIHNKTRFLRPMIDQMIKKSRYLGFYLTDSIFSPAIQLADFAGYFIRRLYPLGKPYKKMVFGDRHIRKFSEEAYEIILSKTVKSETGEIIGYGIKIIKNIWSRI